MSISTFEGARVTVVRSDRKTVSIHIKPDGIYVRAPRRMRDAEITALLESKRSWIREHLQAVAKRAAEANSMAPLTHADIEKLADRAMEYIPKRVQYYAKIIGVDYGRITIRNQRTRWGSCSSKGNLNFNCLLMLFPADVIDSVVVHELCHRKHMNHSDKFYAEVERAFPDYWRCHAWLKEHGGAYLSRMP